jgi:lipid II:glycine glycyltransferase (peptidoglycan interpeptide bridge formation enzyme)
MLPVLARDDRPPRFVELRPRTTSCETLPESAPAAEYCLHTLDLSPGLNNLFSRFHRDCIQRKILRAERENLVVEAGRSPSLLNGFYHLMLLTRRRLQVPPHPIAWFRNLLDTMGESLEISVARKDGRPVAGILTLRFKDTLVYKYGCSDAAQNRLGGMPLLLWRAIQQAKELGVREVDFGRSDLDDPGLIAFKDRWGCTRSRLQYWRWPGSGVSHGAWARRLARPVLGCVPIRFLPAIGKLVTRHLG